MIVAVLAGGRGSRLGGAKPTAPLGDEPLIARVLRAAAGFAAGEGAQRTDAEPDRRAAAGFAAGEGAQRTGADPDRRAAADHGVVVVAKRSTPLPPDVGVPVWFEPDDPFHPLTGLVAALERGGACLAVACDQPWVTGELLAALAAGRAVSVVDGEYEPFPGFYDPSQLPVLREALAEEAGLRRTLARLAPPRLEVDARLVASVNTPEALAAAERRLARAVLDGRDVSPGSA